MGKLRFDEDYVLDRGRLPIREPEYEKVTSFTVAEAPQPPQRFEVKAPEGAPNILLVLLDDMGFGASSAYGGPIEMPTAERLSEEGISFNRFHTTAMCAPTRAALLSGYNHHSCNMGMITELATAYPGNLSTRPKTVTPLARVLKENGYATAQFGKCHETPVWETSAVGPFDHWPTFSGFDTFYGFLGAETNQYRPELVEGLTMVATPEGEDYHLSEDLADKCIDWINRQKILMPEKPFFAYIAPGATHAPHHAPKEYREMFKGDFDEGWDVLRQKTFERMKEKGVIPGDADLAPKPKAIPEWEDLSAEQKELYARQMEIYAGFARHIDDQIGRIIDKVEAMGLMEDTVIIYILGDNGASPEGDFNGVFNELSTVNVIEEPLDYVMGRIEELGTESSYSHYSVGWAVALDAPFTWTKQIASNFGGTRNGMIFHYPKNFKKGEAMRDQFCHVIDIAPTLLDICNIPAPQEVDGIKQRPLEGKSLVEALKDLKAPEIRPTQYFTIGGNNGIYHEGWFAGVVATEPWDRTYAHVNHQWELYNIEEDYSCAHDLAAEMPEKLEEMKTLFYEEALKYDVLPIDNRGGALLDADVAGRPTLMKGRQEITLDESIIGLSDNSFLSIKNKSFEIAAEVEVKEGFTDGVLFSQGGRFGGYSLYVKGGRPIFYYNYVDMERTSIESGVPLPENRSQIKMRFDYEGGGLGKGGQVTLWLNGEEVGVGYIPRTMAATFSLGEKITVGSERGTSVSGAFEIADSQFKGKLFNVNIKILD